MSEKSHNNGGKIVVIGMGLSIVLAYFLMETRGKIFSAEALPKIWLPFLIGTALVVGGMIGAMSLATKLDAKPGTRKILTAFFLTVLLIMTLVIFRMSGIGV